MHQLKIHFELESVHADGRYLAPLGTSLSFSEPSSVEYLPEDDLGRVLLLSRDLPDMTPGDVLFKIGSGSVREMVEKQRECTESNSEGSGHLRLSMQSADSAGNSSACELYVSVDRFRYLCNVLFEMTREYGNFWGENPFPYYIKDHKLFFSTAEDAQIYMRKAWRFLSENHVPCLDNDTAPTVSRAALYRKVLSCYYRAGYESYSVL